MLKVSVTTVQISLLQWQLWDSGWEGLWIARWENQDDLLGLWFELHHSRPMDLAEKSGDLPTGCLCIGIQLVQPEAWGIHQCRVIPWSIEARIFFLGCWRRCIREACIDRHEWIINGLARTEFTNSVHVRTQNLTASSLQCGTLASNTF